MKKRHLIIAILLGLSAGSLCFIVRVRNGDVGDFTWALFTIRALLAQQDPYAFTPDASNIPYPLPVAIFGLPFVWLPWPIAASVFIGGSAGLLAFGILQSGDTWRLWVFASLPFFLAVHFSQWSPLVMASWFFPSLAPLLTMVKPHIALPVAIQRHSWRGIAVALAVVLLSLLLYPTWPQRWLGMLAPYQRLIPVLTLPWGPLVLLATLRLQDERARLLLLMSILPFRSIYDLCLLWLIPANGRQAILLSLLSWSLIPFMSSISGPAPTSTISVLYLPALIFVLWPMLLSPSANKQSPTPVKADSKFW